MSAERFLQRCLPSMAIARPYLSSVKPHRQHQQVRSCFWKRFVLSAFHLSIWFWHFVRKISCLLLTLYFLSSSHCTCLLSFQPSGVKSPLGCWWAADSAERNCWNSTLLVGCACDTWQGIGRRAVPTGTVSKSAHAPCSDVCKPCCERSCWCRAISELVYLWLHYLSHDIFRECQGESQTISSVCTNHMNVGFSDQMLIIYSTQQTSCVCFLFHFLSLGTNKVKIWYQSEYGNNFSLMLFLQTLNLLINQLYYFLIVKPRGHIFTRSFLLSSCQKN